MAPLVQAYYLDYTVPWQKHYTYYEPNGTIAVIAYRILPKSKLLMLPMH